MRQLLYFFRIYRKYLSNKVWWLLVLTIIVGFADGLGISMLLPLLQSLDLNESTSQDNLLFELTDFLGVTGSLTGILGFMFIVFLAKAGLKFATGYYQSNLYRELFRYLKIHFYDALLKVDYQYFTKRNAGYFITIMQGHTNKLIRSFNYFVLLITSIVMTFSYLLMAAIISWQVSLMAVALGSIILGLMTFVNRYVKKISRKISNEETKMNQIAIQALYSFKYIISTASYKPIQNQYNKSIEKLTGLQFKNQLANAFTGSLQELLSVTLLISMILIEVVVLGYPIGAVFVVLLLFYRGVNQLMGIQKNWQTLIENQGFIESVDTEFDSLRKFKTHQGEQKNLPSLNQGTLSLEKLSFHYEDDEKPVLKDLEISIKPNTTVAFVGTSGAGKTTLVDIITGLLKPQQGSVKLNHIHLETVENDIWRSKIGYVAQDLTVFDDTIENNISLFDDNATKEQIQEAAKMASAFDFITDMPRGFKTRIGDKGVRLSGGQKQRLFIARELYKKPDLLILDEATSALDSGSEKSIQESIDKLKGKITVIIIAHRLSTIKNADKIFVLDKGRIIESGTYEELVLIESSQFARMVELQSF
jgi:subfamily B ATP-binding cassette protein MsbA